MNFIKIKEAQSNIKGQQLGSLTWWSLSNNRMEYSKLEGLAEKYDLNKKYLPAQIRPAGAFRRAWRHSCSKLAEGMMLRQITDSDTEIVIGLVKEKPDEKAHDLDYMVEARIIFDKKSHMITSDYENGTSSMIRELYSYHQDLTTSDIRNMMISFLKESSIRIRESGGVYFVSQQYQKTLEALSNVVQSAGDNVVYTLPIFDTKSSKQTLRNIAKATLDDELRLLAADIGNFDKEKMRQSTIDRKLEAFENIRNRAKMFSRILSFKAKSFDEKITELQNSLRRDLGLESVSIPRDRHFKHNIRK